MRSYALERILPVRFPIVECFTLAKPGIVALVIVSTLTGVYLADMGLPDVNLVYWTLAGITLATSGSAILNNYTDRDIDRLMDRTSSRALAAGLVSENYALITGLVFVTLSIVIMMTYVNSLTALLTGVAIAGYVVLYGIVLKRRTSMANQIGGLAGALPPVIGYTAVTGTLDIKALLLFSIMAIWQQPHALSLALKYKDDYARASIPVIPVAKGVFATKLRIAVYTFGLLPVTMLPTIIGMAGQLYLFAALSLGAIYLFLAIRFLLSKRECDMSLFFYSIIYLTLLFTVLVVDLI
ncbi:MAG: heme o synthase [Thermodesulfobacteriota bacterium]